MSSTTVAEFANELKKSADVLLDQLRAAGVTKASEGDALTDADKQKLLSYLQASHGTVSADRKKITLVKKSTSEIKQADASGRARTIQVEVRKKRTLIKRDDEPVAASEEPVEPQFDHADLARREEEARRQVELIRRQEEDLAEKRRQREAQEALQRAELAAQEAQALAQAQAQALAVPEDKAEEPSLTAKPQLSREEREQLARAEAASINAASQAKPAAPAAAEPTQTSADAKALTAAQAASAKAEADKAAREATAQKADAESKAKADEDTARAQDLDARRRKALAEAEAIRAMMSAPKKSAGGEEGRAQGRSQSAGQRHFAQTSRDTSTRCACSGCTSRNACRPWCQQRSQIRQVVVQLGRRSCQEEGDPHPW